MGILSAEAAPHLDAYESADVWKSDPGAQLSRYRNYLERAKIERQMAEGKKETKAIEGTGTGEEKETSEEVRFILKDLSIDLSVVLSPVELAAVKERYMGKEVSLSDLYRITEDINDLYRKKGYLTCRAFLPPQTIHEGKVEIRLVEGKTGTVSIEGNNHTREDYVRRQLSLKEGTIENTDDLNREVYRFNGMNNAQMRISMKAGKEPGTTDYVIRLYEPEKNRFFTVYADNGGTRNTNIYRQGLFYTNRSVFGLRDELSLAYLRSQGMDSFSAGYGIHIGHHGTKLDFDYSTNATEIVNGVLEPVGVKGHSNLYGLTIRQPIRVDEKRKLEGGIRFQHLSSETTIGGIHWIDDSTNKVTPYLALTNYGNTSILYQKHSFDFGDWKNIDGQSERFGIYHMNFLYQKRYDGGQMLQARFDGQMTSEDYLPSSERFYIGGAYSVRGYEESFLSGDKGYAASVEYSVPLDRHRYLSAFTFFDYGQVFGESAFDDYTLAGTGVGLRVGYKESYGSLTLGVPLRRELNGEKVSKTRIHFTFSTSF